MYKENANLNIVKQKVLLCYYRLDKKEEAKKLIKHLNKNSQSEDVHIKEVAEKLDVNYYPKKNFNI